MPDSCLCIHIHVSGDLIGGLSHYWYSLLTDLALVEANVVSPISHASTHSPKCSLILNTSTLLFLGIFCSVLLTYKLEMKQGIHSDTCWAPCSCMAILSNLNHNQFRSLSCTDGCMSIILINMHLAKVRPMHFATCAIF